MIKYFFIGTAILFLISCSGNKVKCGDLLEIYAEKPVELEFIECNPGTGQVILSAKYMVSGENHKKVENFLIKKYNLGELKFVCCGWEPKNGKLGSFTSEDLKQINPNYQLSISMYGNAEKEDEKGVLYIELDLNEIESFSVIVELIDI